MAGRVAAYPIAAEGDGDGADPAAAAFAAAAAAAAARREERERWTIGNTNHGQASRKLTPAEQDDVNINKLIKSGRAPDYEYLKYEHIPQNLLNMGIRTRPHIHNLFTVLRSTGMTRRHMLALILAGNAHTAFFGTLCDQVAQDIDEITTIPDEIELIRGYPVVSVRPYLRTYPVLLPKDEAEVVEKKGKKGKKGKK